MTEHEKLEVDRIIEALGLFNREQLSAVLSAYCRYCGRKQEGGIDCQCENDD